MEIQEVKPKLSKTVFYEIEGKPHEYVLNTCILRFNKQKRFFYQAELLDAACNHPVLIVPLEKVKLSK